MKSLLSDNNDINLILNLVTYSKSKILNRSYGRHLQIMLFSSNDLKCISKPFTYYAL